MVANNNYFIIDTTYTISQVYIYSSYSPPCIVGGWCGLKAGLIISSIRCMHHCTNCNVILTKTNSCRLLLLISMKNVMDCDCNRPRNWQLYKADANEITCHDLLRITDHSEFMTFCPTHTGSWGMYMITPDLQFSEPDRSQNAPQKNYPVYSLIRYWVCGYHKNLHGATNKRV